jgi:pyruvate/2-oxoglutarate dehydrogenase complex dihydrolipoamide acyltransferase (E2) component
MKVPSLGDSISEGTIQKYFKSTLIIYKIDVGQSVKVDEVICSIETDKVTVELKSEFEGVISKVFAPTGQKINVGANFVEIDPSGSASVSSKPSENKKAEPVQEQVKHPPKTDSSPKQTGQSASNPPTPQRAPQQTSDISVLIIINKAKTTSKI